MRGFAEKYGLTIRGDLDIFAEEFAPTNAGVAELVIPPDSHLIGKSPRDILLRKTYGLSLLAITFFTSLCIGAIWWIFRTGWRLRE